jgi:sialic acid synthase SpsE
MHTYIIAEAGSCGDASLDTMRLQIRYAATAGADAVKFQWTSDGRALAWQRGSAKDGYGELYSRLIAWPEEWHEILAATCQDEGVDYLCTAYLSRDVDVVAQHVRHFKIASFEALSVPLLRAYKLHTLGSDRKLIVSTGMCGERDIVTIKSVCDWLSRDRLVLMQCTSSYPTPLADMHLSTLRRYGLTGYSDHTSPEVCESGAWAVAAGAEMVEAHVKLLSTSKDNPDEPHAMMPDQFVRYVDEVRRMEIVMGDSRKRLHESEQAMARYRSHASENASET